MHIDWQTVFSALGWIAFMAILFGPLLVNQQRNQQLVERFARVQRKRKSRIIAIVHRYESMALLGTPSLRSIDLIDAEQVLDAIRRTPPNRPLDIVLHTPGGLVLAATQIARAIKAHPAKKTVFVPHYAMSGGTLIALAADEIVMNPHAVLGPIDPQVDGLPAASLIKVTEQKALDFVGDLTLILADIGRKSLDQLRKTARDLLQGTVSDNAAANIAEELTSGRWEHSYPITLDEARELGLNVSDKMPPDISALLTLFPETIRRRPSVRTVESKVAEPPPSPARDLVTFDGFGGSRAKRPIETRSRPA